MRLFLVMFLLSLMILPIVKAQDTLPGFSASLKASGKVLISWRNNYPSINQISIQRSTDSLKNFTTLVSVPDPRVPENGFVDSKAAGTRMYYRIFILFPNSKYLFTKSRRAIPEQTETAAIPLKIPVAVQPKPVKQTQPPELVRNSAAGSVGKAIVVTTDKPKTKPETKIAVPASPETKIAVPASSATKIAVPASSETKIAVPASPVATEEPYLVLPKIDNSRIFYMMDVPSLKKPVVNNPGKIRSMTIEVQKILVVKRRDSVIMLLAGKQVPRFSDSLVKQTKDTLFFVDADTIQIKPYVEVYKEPKEIYKISQYVFISKDGNVTISLADCNHKKYFVQFFDTDSIPVMELNNIKDPVLIVDKTNFVHAGWYRFELYEDGKLKERNKLLIPKEF